MSGASQSRDERTEGTADGQDPPAPTPTPAPTATPSGSDPVGPAEAPDPRQSPGPSAQPGPAGPVAAPTSTAKPKAARVGWGIPSSAIITAPNAISLGRLLLMPVCAWLLASQHYASGLVLT